MVPRPKVLTETTIDGVEVSLRELHDTDGTYWHVMRGGSVNPDIGNGFSRTFNKKDKAFTCYRTAINHLNGQLPILF